MYTHQEFQKALKIAQTADVTSSKNSVVIYSISFQTSAINREKAFAYVNLHPDKMMIEHTECGAKLVELGFETSKSLNHEQAMLIWSEASRRFIAAASGDITAFVENAQPRSVFLTVELPNILKNENILTINGTDKFMFAQNFENCKAGLINPKI